MKYIYALLMAVLSISTVYADQLIIEPDMGRQPILSAIQNSQQSVNLVMYGFTDQTLLDALLQQKKRNRDLRVILERSPYRMANENVRTIAAFNKNNVTWIGSIPNIRLIHQKTLLIDNKKAIVMTFNFTHSAFDVKASHPNRNFALIVDDPKTVQDIQSVFNADWKQTRIQVKNSNVIFSPDNSRTALLDYIDHAQETIRLYAQTINDYKLVGALASASKRGVKVEALLADNLNEKQSDYLQHANVLVEYSQYYYIHAKVMIIDNKLAIIGSINGTRSSLDDNRELSVVTRDKNVINQLNQTFAHDWELSQNKPMSKADVKKTISFVKKAIRAIS